jgi:CheY-like chemotaxis protein
MQGAGAQGVSPKLVLIVEDNELNLKLLNDILEYHGYQTLLTGSGEEAVALARRHHPDLILLDIQLPETFPEPKPSVCSRPTQKPDRSR